jgi:hypothetical protein
VRTSSSGIRPAFHAIALATAIAALFVIEVNAPQGAIASTAGASTVAASTAVTSPAVAASSVAAIATPTPTTLALRPASPRPASPQPASPRPPSLPAAPARPPAPPAPAALAFAPGQEAWLSIPSIGLTAPVFAGGQATIDRGVVTHYSGPGWRPPVGPGQAGTYWLAAHHVTHGAPFLNLPAISPGAVVVITPLHGPIVRYLITSAQVVGTSADYTTVYGPDSTTPRLLLQTCEGGAYRLLVHGVAIP